MTVAGRVATNPVGAELARSRAEHAAPLPDRLARRVVIDNVRPRVDEGRFPIKRTVGESVEVIADIFADGHDVVVAMLRDRHEQSEQWRESPLTLVSPGTDEWRGAFAVDAVGWHEYLVVAWVDRFRSWRRDLQIKAAAGQDLAVELLEGSLLIRDAAERAVALLADGAPRAVKDDAGWLLAQADALSEATPVSQRVETALGDELGALMDAYADRSRATMTTSLRVWVDRERARFGAWYEMFPRSAGHAPDRSGTFRDAAAHLPYVADLGFDVVYLPPIHPIGKSFRKGRNNGLMPAPADPGSPWAIGSEAGGHTAIEPGLGTMEDFEAFCREAERLGLEVALDLAWQCSPDHPWVREHPEWFRHRPDGSIKYAENPPKKYQDIYPLDFECDDWRGLWRELVRVTLFWVDRGVRIFRVDNPHTKTFGFWEWMIAEVHARDPHVIFLSEAFTRPKVMRHLAKAGFTQSYTYFTWRNTKDEIVEYFTELTGTDVREYLRPNLFTNTPDILHVYLQEGGRPAFEVRLILAATLGASYGIYSGFELCENRAVPGTEEYADSEKYHFRQWAWNRPGHIKELVARVNAIRHQNRALHVDRTLRFHATDNPQIIAYSKSSPDRANTVFVVVNLDPHHMQHGWVQGPPDSVRSLGTGPDHTFKVRDLIDDAVYTWHGEWNYVRFDPGVRQGHIFQLVAGG
ncbi:MAG: alpha-1,4-glucan--maltose-1-phosphate maltosyltransferase [Acidobacteria bacterium]|nr:MAG: alpha-1,4-glucan--maltose-1-phosphate maltosyltransferase [Acidobacteriota bacterium]